MSQQFKNLKAEFGHKLQLSEGFGASDFHA
jgi:hypothetical protein